MKRFLLATAAALVTLCGAHAAVPGKRVQTQVLTPQEMVKDVAISATSSASPHKAIRKTTPPADISGEYKFFAKSLLPSRRFNDAASVYIEKTANENEYSVWGLYGVQMLKATYEPTTGKLAVTKQKTIYYGRNEAYESEELWFHPVRATENGYSEVLPSLELQFCDYEMEDGTLVSGLCSVGDDKTGYAIHFENHDFSSSALYFEFIVNLKIQNLRDWADHLTGMPGGNWIKAGDAEFTDGWATSILWGYYQDPVAVACYVNSENPAYVELRDPYKTGEGSIFLNIANPRCVKVLPGYFSGWKYEGYYADVDYTLRLYPNNRAANLAYFEQYTDDDIIDDYDAFGEAMPVMASDGTVTIPDARYGETETAVASEQALDSSGNAINLTATIKLPAQAVKWITGEEPVPGEDPNDDPENPDDPRDEDMTAVLFDIADPGQWTDSGNGFKTTVTVDGTAFELATLQYESATELISPVANEFAWRVYKNSAFTIKSADDVKMKELVITYDDYSEGKYCLEMNLSDGWYGALSGATYTIACAQGLSTFEAIATEGQVRIKKIEVKYVKEGEPVTPPTPPTPEDPEPATLYFRGTVNGWATPDDWKLTWCGDGIYTLLCPEGEAVETKSQFKIADAAWTAEFNFGSWDGLGYTVECEEIKEVMKNGNSDNWTMAEDWNGILWFDYRDLKLYLSNDHNAPCPFREVTPPTPPTPPTPEDPDFVNLSVSVDGGVAVAMLSPRGKKTTVSHALDPYWKLSTLHFNGKDHTHLIADDSYTTPALDADAEIALTVEYNGDLDIVDAESAVYELGAEGLTVRVAEGRIIIEGLTAGQEVVVYNMAGHIVAKREAAMNAMKITLPGETAYVVRVGADAVKVIL